MSHEKKRARLIREVSTARFKGGPNVLIDEKDLPLPVQEKLRNLRQELRLMNDTLARRNLELYEAKRELRVIHRMQRKPEPAPLTERERLVLIACNNLMDCTLEPGGLEDNWTDMEQVVEAVKALRRT